jgi:glycosyltransferase involved in cell wall biosynthesis
MAAVRRVSVVVPTCDRPSSLRKALSSIRGAEAPGLQLEIIVADNGASPDTKKVAEAFKAVYLKVEPKGPSEARNAAMFAATGEFIAFLDDDDAWLPGHVVPHIEMLDANPQLDGVIGQALYADEDLKPFGQPWPDVHPGTGNALLRRLLSGYFPQIGTAVVRTRVREELGGFDAKLKGGEDLDWLLRMAHRDGLGFTMTPCILFAQRRLGTFDQLQLQRLAFDRKVFHRHALRRPGIWPSPLAYARGYSATLVHFFKYFSDTALIRAERGEKWQAAKAIFTAVRIFPLRSIKHLFSDTPLRRALMHCLLSREAAAQMHHLPIWLYLAHC